MRPLQRIIFTLSVLLLVIANGHGQGVVSAALEDRLASAEAGERLRVYAAFGPRLKLEEHLPMVRGLDRESRRAYAIDLLRRTAKASQETALAYLGEKEDAGEALIIRRLWLNNIVTFEGTSQVIRDVAALENVLYVRADLAAPADETNDSEPGAPPIAPAVSSATISPNLVTINADDVWDLGYRGQGVLVAMIDSRFNYFHPDLVNHNWTNPGEISGNGIDDDGNGYVDDVVGWDFVGDDPSPYSSSNNTQGDGHGTRVAGIVFGDGTSGTCTGVAPDVEAMYLAISGAPESDWWAAYQYAVAEGADVIASSNSRKWPSVPDYSAFRQATDMELLAGVFHANSIGNQGGSAAHPIPFNVATPGNCPAPWVHPDQNPGDVGGVMGCGALSGATSTSISSTSGRGPAAWTQADADTTFGGTYPNPFSPYSDYAYNGGADQGLLKPDVVAPSNTNVVSTSNDYLNGSAGVYYGGFGGTSAATPHLGGMACLLLSADPTLTPERMARIIQETALDLGATGKDDIYGAGRIDCLAAVQRIFEELGGLQRGDVVLMTNATTLVSPLTLIRPGLVPAFIQPTPGDGVAFPAKLGNGAIEHVDNTPYALIAEGTGASTPYDVFLLDFSTGATTPTSHHLGSSTSAVTDIEFDPWSGNAYIATGSSIRAINDPIGPSSFVTAGSFAGVGGFSAGIALSGPGNRLLGASTTTVFRFCPKAGFSTVFFSLVNSGANGIDTDPNTGDIYVNSFSGDSVDRYDRNGVFLETVMDNPYVDGPCDVEFNAENGRVYTACRNGGGRDFCLFGGCVFSPLGEQPGNDNVVIAGRPEVGGNDTIGATGRPNRNTGSVANIMVVANAGLDGGFVFQEAGALPRAPWILEGAGHVIHPTTGCTSDAGFPKVGSRWLEVDAEGSFAATAPSGGTGPVDANTVETTFTFQETTPVLSASLAFVSREGNNASTYNDFGGAVLTRGGTSEVLALLDTFSTTTGTSACRNSDPVKAADFTVDLRTLFTDLRTGEVLTLTFFCGNVADGSFPSVLYVDGVRLESSGVVIEVTQPAPGVLVHDISGAVPNALLLTLITATPTCPRASGPILGLDISALNVLTLGMAPPFWVLADGNGDYHASLPGIPPGIQLEYRVIEFAFGVVNGVSNFEGPIIF